MKVRRTRESLRLRITPTELRSLFAGESVCERSGLPLNGTAEVERARSVMVIASMRDEERRDL